MLLTLAVAFLFGTFIGSFLNVCVHRMPRNESVVLPPSRCYSCGTRLTWYDNLPVIGWLLLRGHCRWCGTPFSARYLFAELAVGALTALTVWWSLRTGTPWTAVSPLPAAIAAIAALLVLVWTLYVSSIIDLDHQIIPDELTKSFQVLAPFLAVAAGTGQAFGDPVTLDWAAQVDVFGAVAWTPMRLFATMGSLVGAAVVLLLLSLPFARYIYSKWATGNRYVSEVRWTDDDHRFFALGVKWFAGCSVFHFAVLAGLLWLQPHWWQLSSILLAHAILGSLAGWFSLYAVGLFGSMLFRKNAMGFGDVKFLAPIGAFLGPMGVLYAFVGATVIGTMVGIPALFRIVGTRLRLLGRAVPLLGGAIGVYLRASRLAGAALRRLPVIGSFLGLLAKGLRVPFGPYLAIGTLLALVFGKLIRDYVFTVLLLPPA